MTTTTNRRDPRNSDALDALMQSASRFPVLSRAREHELAVAYHERGDRGARELLVNSNLRFVARVAAEYRSYRMDMADLVQAGCIGLITAVDRYDPTQGNRLLSYAVWRIRSEIQDHIMRNWALVRVLPSGAQRKLLFGRHHEGGKAAETVGKQKLQSWHTKANTARFYKGLDAPVTEGGLTVEQTLPSSEPDASEKVVQLERFRALRKGLKSLSSKLTVQQTIVLNERVLSEDPKTLREIGEKLGVSCERVRQVELLVKRRLARELRGMAA
jgi:RNA polymerase sigma-32 factor